MKKYTEILTEIGLTQNEARIYQTLLDLKRASIWDISAKADIHRRNTYDAVQRLVEKGLAYQILPKKTLTYAPVHPDKLREMVNQKVEDLESVLPGLSIRFDEKQNEREVYVYRGIGGVKNYIELITRVGKDVYGIGSKGSWFDVRSQRYMLTMAKKYFKAGIKTYPIFDAEVQKHPDMPKLMKLKKSEYKFLPKKYSSKSSFDVFGEYIAIYSDMTVGSFGEDITIYIIHDKILSHDMKKWWQFMWDFLPKEK